MAIERGRLPAGWRWSALADVSRIVGGSTPSSSVQEYWNGDILWVTPTDLSAIVGRTIDDSARKITQEGFASAGLERLPAGSVVMSSRAPIGYLAIAGRPLTTNQGCKSFVPSESLIIPDFLYLALSFQMPAIVAAGAGTTFAEVSKSKLESIEIALPAIPEQRRIVAALNERLSALFRAREVAAMQEEEIELLDSCMRESLLSSGAGPRLQMSRELRRVLWTQRSRNTATCRTSMARTLRPKRVASVDTKLRLMTRFSARSSSLTKAMSFTRNFGPTCAKRRLPRATVCAARTCIR